MRDSLCRRIDIAIGAVPSRVAVRHHLRALAMLGSRALRLPLQLLPAATKGRIGCGTGHGGTEGGGGHRFAFAYVTLVILAAKAIQVMARQKAFVRRELITWMPSFFAQDLALLLALRFLVECSWSWSTTHHIQSPTLPRYLLRIHLFLLRAVCVLTSYLTMLFSAVVSTVNITFYLYAGAEVRWRDVGFASDSSSRGVLLSGSLTLFTVLLSFSVLAFLLQNVIFSLARSGVDAVKWPFAVLADRIILPRPSSSSSWAAPRVDYTELTSIEEKTEDDEDPSWDHIDAAEQPVVPRFAQVKSRVGRLVWGVFIAAQILLHMLRPVESDLIFMSWTTPIAPFVHLQETASVLRDIRPYHGGGINHDWDDKTALQQPVRFDWLPKDTVLAGFEDWYANDTSHYSAEADPLRISNLDQELLPQLKDKLAGVSIRHIVMVVLESTRKDLFPIKKDGLIWRRFQEASPNRQLSDEAAVRLASLTHTANHLTGDFDDGFEHDPAQSARGGLSFRDANTASTYTRKSIIGTMCGIWPLVADFNQEHLHHIYQPCLPQILAAFSHIDSNGNQSTPSWDPWRPHYLQSVTLGYDHAKASTAQMGFPLNSTVDSLYLRSKEAKFGPVDQSDINYFGMAEAPALVDYFRDAFAQAKQRNERVFLTHLTSTTHHPYKMPDDEKYVPLAAGNSDWENLSHYVNSAGYGDRWLSRILAMLDEAGVANETLVVAVGDHGISLPENNTPASYQNPNAGCNHVPLVMSHPALPAIDISDTVSTMEILPTILDLLRSTSSLSAAAAAAAGDLIANYEGRSLIRALGDSQLSWLPSSLSRLQKSGSAGAGRRQHGNWQFIVMNPGRAMLGVRDRRHKNWRVVVPVLQDVEWRFTDLTTDPTDTNSVQAFKFIAFLRKIEQFHGKAAAQWAEEAAFIARWWLKENNERWRYGLDAAIRSENATSK